MTRVRSVMVLVGNWMVVLVFICCRVLAVSVVRGIILLGIGLGIVMVRVVIISQLISPNVGWTGPYFLRNGVGPGI